jgi:hypothetical protein
MGEFLKFRGKNRKPSLEESVKQLERRARRLAGNNQSARFRGTDDAHITVETKTVNAGWFKRKIRYTKVGVVEEQPEGEKIFRTVEVQSSREAPVGSFTQGHIDAQGNMEDDNSVFGVDKEQVDAALANLNQTKRRLKIDDYGRTEIERSRDAYIASHFRQPLQRLVDRVKRTNAIEEIDGQSRVDFRQVDGESDGTRVAIITGELVDGYIIKVYPPTHNTTDEQPYEGYFIPSVNSDHQQILYQVFNFHYLPDGERSEGGWEYTQVATPEQLTVLQRRIKSISRDLVLAA